MTYEHATMLVRRLFAVIGLYPTQVSDLDTEIKFQCVMTRNHPYIDWDDVILSVRVFES